MPLATAPLARFIEAAGQLRGAWYDAKECFSKNLCGKPHKLEELDSAEELLDDAVANAESILKGCARLMQPEKGFPQPPALSSFASPTPEQDSGRGMAGSEKEAPWRQETAKPTTKPKRIPPGPPSQPRVAKAADTMCGKRKNESVDWDSPRSKPTGPYRSPAEWKVVRDAERKATRDEKWTPGWTSIHDFYSKILPERLARLPQTRLRDLLQEAVEKWLKKRGKRTGNVGEVDTAPLDQIWNSPKFKVIFPFIDPPIESLENWVSTNMDDVSVHEDDHGRTMLSRRRVDENDAEEEEQYQEELNEFLAAMPEDRLTDAEEELREALLSFLEDWHGESTPLIVDAYKISHEKSIEVYLAMCVFIPRRIKLRDWIVNRIGQEVEVLETDSGFALKLAS
eukprot:TRINITY_DN26419_c0_g1_i1.p1 TRINITY_DN26419_c0_g1~~TRINITY_DN26419_c0_g1_i1.p1  ORF type:complete len:397 (-),score=66.70 TRINITY_DN26419_c0_g1_i1:128-1318(-)